MTSSRTTPSATAPRRSARTWPARSSSPLAIPASEIQEAKAENVMYDFVLEVDEHARALSVGIVDETAKTFGLRRVAVPQRRK